MEQTEGSIQQKLTAATPAQEELNLAIDVACRRGDDEQVNALLRAKQILVWQHPPPVWAVRRRAEDSRPGTERAA